MPLCPLLHFKPPLSVLKDRTNISYHPWETTIKSVYYDRIKGAHNSVKNPVYPKPKKKPHRERIQFTVIGIRTCKEFIYCVNLVKGMHKYRSKTYDVPVIKGLSSAEWPSAWYDLKIAHGGYTYCVTTPVIILQNGEFFGGDKELKEFIESKYIYRICLDYRKEAIDEFSRYVKSTGRPFAYMHISIDENPIGTMIFMLYSDIVPNTCENFLRLCMTRKGGYSGTPIHRIVEDGWIQCGGFALKDTNLNCENFAVPHNRRGVLGMCNDGRGADCSTQFFVLLQPCEWMDHKYVAFGQLVEGEETFKKIENVPTYYEAPTSSIIIEMAGILNLDCKDITINRNAREYISNHIEDLIEREEFFIELLLQRVWAAIEAKEKDIKQDAEQPEEQTELSIPSSESHPTSKMSPPSTQNKADVENQEFAAESYTMLDTDEYRYPAIASLGNTRSSKIEKPFYMPLTDVKYPGEVDSTFDLKKFLSGNYCLESDLQEDLAKDEKQREVLKIVYSNLPSDMFLFDEDDYIPIDSADVDSSEEEEIRNYIKNNVDRVSFAGDVVKNIGTVCKGQAMFNLFEGKRKSELPFVTDDDLKRLRRISVLERRQSRKQSEIPTFTDEDIRKLRRASAIERKTVNPYDRRASIKKVSMAPTVPVELPKLISTETDNQPKDGASPLTDEAMKRLRRASRAAYKRFPLPPDDEISSTSKESIELEELPKIVDPGMIEKMKRKSTFDKRRHSVFDPLKSRSQSPAHVEGLRKSQIDKLRRISMFDADQQSIPDKPRAPSVKESFDKKRRQTVFAKDIAQVQSYQTDVNSEESSSLDVGQQKTIRFPSGTPETHKEIKRRQTGYIHEEDLDRLNLDLEEQEVVRDNQELNIIEGGAIKLAIPVKEDDPQTIERRQTGFVRPTPSLLEDIKDISVVRNTSTERVSSDAVNPTLTLLGNLSSMELIHETKQTSFDRFQSMEHLPKYFDKKKGHKERTSKPPRNSEDELSKIAHLRESVFLRLYGDTLLSDRNASPPTLKNYKPMSEIIPSAKNMFLTYGKGIHFDEEKRSPHLRRSKIVESDLSFMTMSGIKFGRKSLPAIDTNFRKITERENPIVPGFLSSQKKHSKMPVITVEDYQRKNRERLEKLKKADTKKLG